MLYIWTSARVLHTPNSGQNILFRIFGMKNVKKEKKKKFGKKSVFGLFCYLFGQILNVNPHFRHQRRTYKTFTQIFFLILPNCSCFFSLFYIFHVKKHNLTSIWSAQHPNAGQNLQHAHTHTCAHGECFCTPSYQYSMQ